MFDAAVEGGASPEALFLVSAGKITPLALMGDPAPGAGGGQCVILIKGEDGLYGDDPKKNPAVDVDPAHQCA